MEELVDLFQKTYSSDSNSEIIAEATKMIQAQFHNQLFYQTCLQIIFEQNDQITITCKKSALNAFAKGIKDCWKNTFDDDMKMYLLNQIPELLANSPYELVPLCEKFSDEIINFSIFEDNCSYLIEALPHLFQNDINYQRAGLIISKSVCKKIKNPRDDMMQMFSEFASLISPLIANLCKECEDYVLLNYCYHCLSRLLMKLTENEIAEQILQEYGEIYYGRFMSLCTNFPSNIDENFSFIKFLIEGIKFLIRISRKLDNEQIENIIQFIQSIFQLPAHKYLVILKAKAVALLNSMIIKNERYDIFESHMQLIMEIIFSQLMISDEDIQDMENDPEAFIQANPSANINWEDDKASCSHFLLNCIKRMKNSSLIDFVYETASSSLQSESRNQIFTAFRILTTAVSKNCKDQFEQFLPFLLEAFNHPDFVVRAGSFFVLSATKCCNISQQIIDNCITHLNDEAPIVRYYASLALSQSLFFCKRQQEYKQCKKYYSSQIGDICNSLFEILSQFNDSYISDAFTQIVKFFDDEILPYAIQLFDQITEVFVSCCTSGESQFSEVEETTTKVLGLIIKIAGKNSKTNPDALNEFCGHFYSKICSAISATSESQNVYCLFPLLSELITISPGFNPEFWELLEPLMGITSSGIIIIDDSAPVIEQIIYKDEELASREEIVSNLCTFLLNSGALISVPTFCSTLIMRVGPSLPCMSEIFATIKSEASECDVEGLESISNIVSAIFLNFDDFSPLFEGGDMTLFNIWIEKPHFPFYVASFLKVFNKFDQDVELQAQMLKSGFFSVSTGFDNEEEEEFSDDDDDDDDSDNDFDTDFQANPGDFGLSTIKSPQWFNEKELIQQFLQFVSGLVEEQSPVVQAFGQEDLINQMNKYT